MTTDVSQSTQIEQELNSSNGPGEALREARKNKGLTIADLADRLKVPEAYITGIESNEYDAMSGLVFARGYIRSYCRAVGLSGDEIVSWFDRFTGSDRQDVPHLKPGNPISNRRHMSPVIAWSATLLIIIVVGAFSYFSWNKRSDTSSESLSADVIVPEAIETEPARIPLTPLDTEASEKNTELQTPEANADLMAAEEEELADGNQFELLEQELTEAAVTDAADTAEMTTAEAITEAESVEPEYVAAAVDEDPSSGAESGNYVAKLEIQFAGDCWVQVKDMAGKTLYSDTKKAGTSLEMDVPDTVRVRFGNVQGVAQLNFDGRNVDVSSAGRKVASLVLDSSDAG